jgi:phosphoglycolate phosphatase-like HAD superfamily hydrolase
VLYGYGSREEHTAAGAAYIVKDLDELRELLIVE